MTYGLRIGVFGGSFNPAHDGHYHVAVQSMRRLRLDRIWWLPSPQNPLKTARDMASYPLRRNSAARYVARHPRFALCEIEHQMKLRYTAQTLDFLHRRYPRHRFVWLMGADNLRYFHHWQHWQHIAQTTPIVVIDRAPHHHDGLRAVFAQRYRAFRTRPDTLLSGRKPHCPRWSYLFAPRHPESATRLRKTFGETAFLR